MSEYLFTRINWLYCSIKEQYKFINLNFNKVSSDLLLMKLLENEIYFYKTSLVLFKKSFAIFEENNKKNSLNKEEIMKAKELYLRRCLYNLNNSYEKLINNNFVLGNPFVNNLLELLKRLILTIKELGRNLDNWVK